MTTRNHDGNTFVYWLPACADTSAPTVAEIAAGTKLSQDSETGESFSKSETRNSFDDGNAEKAFVPARVGTWSVGDVTVTVKDNDSVAWHTTISRGETGFLLKSTRGAAVATTKVEVYPAEAHAPETLNPATNDQPKIALKFAVTGEPNLYATVAA